MEFIHENRYLKTIQDAIDTASFSVWVMAYNIGGPRPQCSAPYAAFWSSLMAAPGRGLDCRLLLPNRSDGHTESVLQHDSIMRFASHGWRINRVPGGRLLHAKAWLIDGRLGVVTSANLSESGLTNNIETMIKMEGASECLPLLQQYVKHWRKASRAEF